MQHTRDYILASIFTALTIVGAFIKIPLFLVPVTLQTLFTILAGNLLQPRFAFLSQLVYVMLGLAGLPVFTLGGGISYVLQPTFGYLVALPFAAGLVAHVQPVSYKKRFLINLLALILILLIGTLWLFLSINIFVGSELTFKAAFLSGFWPFIPGALLKAIIVTVLVFYMKNIWKMNII